MSSSFRSPAVIATTAAVIITPILLLNILPRIRTPTKKPSRALRALPEGVIRTTTPTGLELLVAHPTTTSTSESGYSVVDVKESEEKAPVLLLHGGFGSALCYIYWLPYLASKGRTVYSLSLSGHGQSPRPDNLVTMSASDFAPDLTSTIAYIHTLHPSSPLPILVGHSAGGGLSQHILSTNNEDNALTSGVVLVDAFPPTGGWSVYLNWAILDPLFALRMLFKHGGDPKSPLSTPQLVHRIFFGPKITPTSLGTFFEDMNHEESISWPESMMFPFVDVEKVKKSASGRVSWISGEEDKIMTPRLMKKAAEKYGAPLRLIKDAGHHLPRDAVWKDGADALLAQLDEWRL